MKLVIAALFCFLFVFNLFAQEISQGKTADSETVAVAQLFLAKDDGEGKAGDEAESFLTTDIPIYCVVDLSSAKAAIVKMNFVAVSVPGVKAESRVISVSYKTNGRQNRVSFTGKPESLWVAGTYRIDIFIDDKPAVAKSFEIKKSPSEIQKNTAQVQNFIVPKPKTKPRTVKNTRKN